MSIQTLTRRQHGRRSHLYGTFRAKPRGHRPTPRLPTTRLRNSISSSTIQRAPIIAEAAAAKVKRAIDRVATVTATSTRAGASRIRRVLWVSRAPDEWLVQTWSVYGLQAPRNCIWHCLIPFSATLTCCKPWLGVPSFSPPIHLLETASSAYPTWRAGVVFFFFFLHHETWVALDKLAF